MTEQNKFEILRLVVCGCIKYTNRRNILGFFITINKTTHYKMLQVQQRIDWHLIH